MKNPLSRIFCPDEQRILLAVAVFLILGSVLQLTGYQTAAQPPTLSDSLLVSLKEDKALIIDIRTATKAELMALSGIGDKRADDIINYRERHPFQNVNELINVSGIGIKTYQRCYPNLLVFGDSLAVSPSSSPSLAAKTPSSKAGLQSYVNINTANLKELCSLSGIGHVKAQAIMDYRKEHGPFQSPEDLIKVKGIGPKTLQKNLSRLCTE
ncbi:MAG: helix-hairpin-helix domain-containing protein [Candidatus Cloacimonadaceae bacterium]|jgi:competence protein ComEA|nr:helix-hairpin-helix domain-containing protein [Candidatus Cloacimonadota bacterium]MCK9242979.1 helix-hairpin-helix domain-containing protein [Candidatus Cloacimonadota bacterium]